MKSKLTILALVSTILIFFIRIFYKEAIPIFNKNFDLLFGIYLDKVVIYIYQIIVLLFLMSIKKVNTIILVFLLLLNTFLIISYCINLEIFHM